jgi:hypothetical protein
MMAVVSFRHVSGCACWMPDGSDKVRNGGNMRNHQLLPRMECAGGRSGHDDNDQYRDEEQGKHK